MNDSGAQAPAVCGTYSHCILPKESSPVTQPCELISEDQTASPKAPLTASAEAMLLPTTHPWKKLGDTALTVSAVMECTLATAPKGSATQDLLMCKDKLFHVHYL